MDIFLQANAEFSKFSRNYMEQKKDLPIRPSEMGVLNIITQTAGPHTPLMLAEKLGVSKSMIAAHLAVLEKKGYIEKRRSMEDKRVFFVLPTEKARNLASYARIETENLLREMMQKMGQEHFETLLNLISQANCALESQKRESTGPDSLPANQ